MADMVAEMAERLFSDSQVERSAGDDAQNRLWAAVEEAGLPLALLSEDDGGFGFATHEAMGIIRVAAAHAVSAPVADAMLANWLLAATGLAPSSGHVAVAIGPAPDEGRLRGIARRVPWGRSLRVAAVPLPDGRLLRLERGWVARYGANLAGEPRDDLEFDCDLSTVESAPVSVDVETVRAAGAVIRTIAIAGAIEAALGLSVGYANDRVQFGRPIGKFQAVQQSLAVMAGQAAAARAAADMMAEAFTLALTAPGVFRFQAAAAKVRAGEAAGACAAIAHQVHGAIGFTHEYALHSLTRRLWSWRDEWGGERYWAERIGAAAFAQGPEGLWPFLTRDEGAAQ